MAKDEKQPTVTVDALQEALAKIAAMEAEAKVKDKQLADAKALADSKLRLAVGDSGGISIYGLQQFPVTLTVLRWRQCFEFMDKHFEKFVSEHLAEINAKTTARNAQRELERSQKQPRNLGNNGPVVYASPEQIEKLNREMKQ